MKEFDLEAAKAGKKVETRDGRNVRIVCYDYKGNAPLLVIVENKNSEPLSDHLRQYVQKQTAESVHEYYENGEVCAPHLNSSIASDLTLVMATEKNVYYVNIYENYDARLIYKQLFETYEEAYRNAMSLLSVDTKLKYITTTKLEWEE